MEHQNFGDEAGCRMVAFHTMTQAVPHFREFPMRKYLLARVSRRTSSSIAASAALCAALSVAGTQAAFAQPAAAPQPPTIFVSARGEVQVAPDRAKVQVGVETQAKTAAAAAQENNRKQTAILAGIRALGINARDIQTLNYSVMPIQRYDDKLRRVVIDGYQVSNIVQVETDKLELAGQIIDAGLTNGANRVAGLDFLVKERAKAQETAITQAVASARRQAEVAARAAGGQVVELMELIINESEPPIPRQAMMAMKVEAAADGSAAPISEGTATITVNVATRWRFAKN